MNPRQQDLFTDRPRGEQLQALRKIKLESFKHRGRSVSGAICKSVLRAIDDRAGERGCFASQATIAEEVGCGVATVSRAIAALVAQDLITIEKVNPWSPNTHRINFTEVYRRVAGSNGQRQEQTLPKAKSAMAVDQDRHGQRQESSLPQARQIAPLIDQVNDPPTATPAEWVRVRKRLNDLGMKAATQATTAARERGLSLEYIEDLIQAATKHTGTEPPPGVGWLCHWLTGKADPPFDEDEAQRRRDERESIDATKASAIREGVHSDRRAIDADMWVIHGITFRKLAAAGLDRFATDDERSGAVRMDTIDRERERDERHAAQTTFTPPSVKLRRVPGNRYQSRARIERELSNV